jgi:hypothetical protein
MIKHKMIILISALMLTSLSVPCSASENALRDLLENTVYGGLVGTIVGGAFIAFTHKPADHLDYLAFGAATGVLGGVTYSVVKQTMSLVSIDDGNVKFAMPTIIPELQENGTKGGSSLMLKAELFRGKF